MNTILVIGATGMIGTHVLEEFKRRDTTRDQRVVCGVRSDTAVQKISARGFESVPLDLDDSHSVERAVRGVSTIFFVKSYSLKMLNHARCLADTAAAAGVASIVNLSAYGPDDSNCALLTWHRLVDRYIEASGVGWTHLRPAFFMEGLAARIDRQRKVVNDLSNGAPVAWVAAEDIARCAAEIIGNPADHLGKAYPLVADVRSVPDIAELLEWITGTGFAATALDRDLAIQGLLARGRERLFAEAIIDYATLAPAPDGSAILDTISDISKRAPISLTEFLQKAI